ncbi:MAG: metallophosphoesterase family protein [Bacteroides sp.]
MSMTVSAQKNILKFNADKKFKIVQFTDLHIKHLDPRSDIAFTRMNEVLDLEKPDLVVFTGDLIYSSPAADNLKKVLKVAADRHIPFAVTFGNHDHEQGLSNDELFKIISATPYNVTIDEVSTISGVGNCALALKDSQGKKDVAVLYCFDSNQYSTIPEAKGYDYIKSDQIKWYQQRSEQFTHANGDIALPSLAFFHIPLQEFNQAATNENASLYGIRREKACSSYLNSGLFKVMKKQADVMGIFVGHDHDNDYAVNWQGILLAYGRFTGGPTEYTHIPNGARVIELTENSRAFKTWIRLANKEIQQSTIFPNNYIKNK